MKRIKYIIYITVILILLNAFLYCVNSYTTGKVLLNINKTIVEVGENIEVAVKIQNCKTVAYHFNLYFDNNKLDFISEENNTNVIGNRVIHVWYDKTGGKKPKKDTLVTFKFRAKQNGKVTFGIGGEFYSEDFQLIKTDYEEAEIQIEKTILEKKEEQGNDIVKISGLEKENTNLETLAIQNVLLNPPFDTNITQYKIEVPNNLNNLNMLAIPQNENAKVEIKGKDKIKEGENQIKVIVTAENGYTKREYIINAHKRGIKEEQKYKEEQEENAKKLKEIYESERTSSDISNKEPLGTFSFGYFIHLWINLLLAHLFSV